MKYDFKRAFSYLFSDKTCFLKLTAGSIGVLLALCALVARMKENLEFGSVSAMIDFFVAPPFQIPYSRLLDIIQLSFGGIVQNFPKIALLVVNLLILSFLFGYYLTNIKERMSDGKLPPLKDFRLYFVRGFKYTIGSILLALPAVIVVFGLIQGTYFYFDHRGNGGDDLGWLVQIIRSYLVLALCIIGILPVFLINVAGVLAFVHDFKFKSIFKIANIIFGNSKIYIKNVLVLTLLNILYFIISIAVCIGGGIILELTGNYGESSVFEVALVLIWAVFQFAFLLYYCAVTSDIQAQSAKNTVYKED